jgi:L-lactate dehydrogenase complex protein LldF
MSETKHADAAALFIADEERTAWHNETLWLVRKKRDQAAQQVTDWEWLRSRASAIKDHTLSKLDEYLLEFERNAIANHIHIHWARDGREHNEIVLKLIHKLAVTEIIKSKSMLTEECHLNEYLQDHGINITDTDLGEYIVQLRNEMPSHIVLPAIHLRKEDVSNTFHEKMGTERGNADPKYLTAEARKHLRKKFIGAQMAITGVNFAVAETGGIVICTNEGNADLGVHAADIHIASMGIEKLIPKTIHLGVFLRLLARSATGQAITAYSSHFYRPREGQQMHIIIVDNGRTRQLGKPDFRNSLKCIRCGACFNTCPVYRFSGGHSYHNAVAGPIGSILSPNFDMKKNVDLPFASSLCGSCSNVCPVKIDIDKQLWKWRQVLMREGHGTLRKELSMRAMAFVLGRPFVYRVAGKFGRRIMLWFPQLLKSKKWNNWYRQRELPDPPSDSFLDWYKKRRR